MRAEIGGTLAAVESEAAGLIRFWFEFDLTEHAPDRQRGNVQLDGGTPVYRILGLGAGVTGYDEADCLRLLRDALDDDLPPVQRVERNPAVEARAAQHQIGNPAWRGVWFPPLNLAGPTIG